ncbi:hemin ABC transporter substrate-binding protein [Pseudomonas sp. NPDC089734]|uniref:heme/hemin ABC transporter substrate-binding protein n=1 Tax=Pseudomonas sp. NPDC089734 TaxID=3364469 RepID=UPI0038150376
MRFFNSGLLAAMAGIVFSQLAHAAPTAAPETSSRWVSAGGALTEWVVAMGAQARLVGVDTTSQHPESLKSLPSIGYQRQLSSEGILSLRPDVLVGTEEMGPPPVLAQLRAANVKVEAFSADPDMAALKSNLQRLGALLGDTDRAARLIDSYQQQMDNQQVWIAQAQKGSAAPGVLLLVGHGGGKPMVAGKGTAGDWLIRQAGGHNLATHDGYKVFSVEAMAGLSPKVLIVADRTLRGEAARKALFKENPALAATPAAKDGRLFDLDPTLLVGGLGPRLPESLQQLSQAFYPDARPLSAAVRSEP